MCGRLRVGKSFQHVCSIGRCSHDGINSPTAATDRSQLAYIAKETKSTLEVEKLDAVADHSYFNSEEILECEEVHARLDVDRQHAARSF